MAELMIFSYGVDELRELAWSEELDTAEEVKCPGCNWSTSALYQLAENEAVADLEIGGGGGMCDACLVQVLVRGYRILTPKP